MSKRTDVTQGNSALTAAKERPFEEDTKEQLRVGASWVKEQTHHFSQQPFLK